MTSTNRPNWNTGLFAQSRAPKPPGQKQARPTPALLAGLLGEIPK